MKFTQNIGAFLQQHKLWIVLTLCIVFALYPLSFFQHIPKWDSVRGYLPYRFFISDYINDGHLPLWNPFQRLGYPGYSDLQSGCWYPVVWLLMLFGQYDITSLIVEVVFTFLIAAWGMFRLSNYVFNCKRTSFLLALSYGLSGFMVGSAQLLVFLIGMAWLPWILWAWLCLLKGGGLRYTALLAFFLVCNITGASPAYTIILIYILPIIGLYHLWRSENRKQFFLGLIKPIIWVSGLLFMLLLPFIVSFVDFMPYFNRTGKLPFEAITLNPYTIGDYISFLFPYSVISTHDMFQLTDLSLRNSYVGLVCFAFFLITVFTAKYRTQWYWPLVGCFVFSMWLALGSQTFIYKWVYHLPGFGLFRHPSFFRGYAILCMLLLAGFSLRGWMSDNKDVPRKFVQRLAIAIALVSAIAFFLTTPGSILKTMLEIYHEAEFPAEGFSSQLFLNCLIVVAILLLVNFLHKRYSLNLFWTLGLFLTIDLFIQTRLTAPTTLYHGEDYAKTAAYFDTLAQLPSHQQQFNWVPLKLMDETRGLKTSKFLETNVSTYNRTISSVGENPFRFRAFDVAKDNGMLEWVLQNPLMYFPQSICMDGGAPSPGCLFQHKAHLDNIGKGCELNDVQVGHNNYEAWVKNPNDSARWLVLSANYHHLWRAEYNGGLLPIEQVNSLCMGVLIPPHTEGEIQFVFESKALVWAILLSAIAWCFLGYMIVSKRFIWRLDD